MTESPADVDHAVGVTALLDSIRAADRPEHLPRLVKEAARLKQQGAWARLKPLRVAVLANCTLRPAVDMLGLQLLQQGINAEVWEAPFDQWASELVSPNGALSEFDPQVVILYLSSLGLSRSGTQTSFDILPLIEGSIGAFAERSSATILLVLPEPLEEEAAPFSEVGRWRRAVNAELERRLSPRVLFIDLNTALAGTGIDKIHSPRFWYSTKLPCHPSALLPIGRHLAVSVAACRTPRIKLIACDFDNTLWGGVVGEDGWAGVDLDPFGSGAPFLRLQAYLKRLKDRGVLLAAVSKNNQQDALDVFERRQEMILAWSDFVLARCGWQEKSRAIVEITETLNIDVMNVCFIDDSPFEREQVRSALPDVVVPELPVLPEDYVGTLVRTGLFDTAVVTDEDRQRTSMYHSDLGRKSARMQCDNLEEFLSGLGLIVETRGMDAMNIERAAQLLARTNQFNVTTRRHDSHTLQKFSDDRAVYTYCFRVKDRFGDNGLCGILIALPETGNGYVIDSWALSCRVMGRTIERAMFKHLVDWLRDRGVAQVQGIYLPTAKNLPVERLYDDLGFVCTAEGDAGKTYRRDVALGYDGNRFVRIVESS